MFFDFKKLKEMFSFSAWLLFDSIAIWLTNYIGTFIVGRELDEYYLGLYKTAMTTVNSITNIIVVAVTPVMFSQLSRCQNDDLKMKETFYTYQRLSAVILIPLGVGFFVFKDFVTWILLGEQWTEAAGFVGLWGLMSSMSIVLSNYCSAYYRSKGKPKIALITQVIYLCVLIPTLAIGVRYSFTTLYVSRSLITLFQIVLTILIMRILFKVSIRGTVFNVLPSSLAAIVMGVTGHALKDMIDSYIWQICCVIICILVYFTVLLICFPKTRAECLGLLKRNTVNK